MIIEFFCPLARYTFNLECISYRGEFIIFNMQLEKVSFVSTVAIMNQFRGGTGKGSTQLS